MPQVVVAESSTGEKYVTEVDANVLIQRIMRNLNKPIVKE